MPTEKERRRSEFFKYVIPSIGAMLVTSLYVVVDGIFVGQGIGANALAAINIAGPFIMTIVAMTMMMTVGGATLTAISLGQKKVDQANEYFSVSMKMIISFSLLMMLISVLFPKPIVRLLGANEVLVEDAASYLMFFVLFGIFFCSAMALAAFVRNDGSPRLAFWGMVAGGVSNIFLDWLFIFPLHMGIIGPAIASGLGQTLSCIILLSHFVRKKGQLHMQKTHITKETFKEIFKRGTPEFMNQLFQPITVLCYNLLAIRIYGEIGVAAFSVVYYILTITVSIFIGLTQGTQPLISLSYGQGNRENEKYYYHMGIGLNVLLSLIIYVLMVIFGKPIITAFNADPELVAIGYQCIKIYGISFLFTAINIVVISYYTARKQTANALLLSTLRCLLFIPIFVFLVPMLLGDAGIWLGITVAEIFSLICAAIIDYRGRHNKTIIV